VGWARAAPVGWAPAVPLGSTAASSSLVTPMIMLTARSKASATSGGGSRKPLTVWTYWSAAARTSSSVTLTAYGVRKILMLRHMKRR
jgi:hypothetical protein